MREEACLTFRDLELETLEVSSDVSQLQPKGIFFRHIQEGDEEVYFYLESHEFLPYSSSGYISS